MGSPIESQNPAATINGTSQNASSSKTTESTNPPLSLSNLPPAALDLAAKLFDLARAGDTSTLSAYLQAGVPKNLTNHNGDTLLMLAGYHGHPDTVRMLLQMGADPNALNSKGQSPVAGAVFKGYNEVVEILVKEGGADVTAGHPTAVDTAVMFRRDDLLRILGMSEEGGGGGDGNVEVAARATET